MKEKRIKFEDWTPASDVCRYTNRTMGNHQFRAGYQRMVDSIFNDPDMKGRPTVAVNEAAQCDCMWHDLGRPYYKVWPGIVLMLMRTSMRFTGEMLQTPYPVFSVSCSDGENSKSFLVASIPGNQTMSLRDFDESRFSMSAGHQKQKLEQEKLEQKFGPLVRLIMVFWRGSHDFCAARLPVYGNQLVEDAINDLTDCDDELSNEIYDGLPWSSFKKVMKAIIGVAMFGVDRHELVAPDIDRQVLEQRFPGGKSKGSQQIAKARIEREIVKCKGWLVGSEIDLPRPHVIRHGQPEERGGELEFGHVRSGHMRMQPCGVGGKDRKLIFVAPTVVRPDLPQRQSHGYRIHDKLLKSTPANSSLEAVEAK